MKQPKRPSKSARAKKLGRSHSKKLARGGSFMGGGSKLPGGPRAHGAAFATHGGSKGRGLSRKLAVSFDSKLATLVQNAATGKTGGNVSAWLAEAAEDKLRLEGLQRLVAEYEAEHGPFTEEEMAEADRRLGYSE
jgi:hypothetical protein